MGQLRPNRRAHTFTAVAAQPLRPHYLSSPGHSLSGQRGYQPQGLGLLARNRPRWPRIPWFCCERCKGPPFFANQSKLPHHMKAARPPRTLSDQPRHTHKSSGVERHGVLEHTKRVDRRGGFPGLHLRNEKSAQPDAGTRLDRPPSRARIGGLRAAPQGLYPKDSKFKLAHDAGDEEEGLDLVDERSVTHRCALSYRRSRVIQPSPTAQATRRPIQRRDAPPW